MPAEHVPDEVPLYEDQAALEEGYRRAEGDGAPFIAVERYDEGYAVTYDLLPTGSQLSKPARKELREQLVRHVERIVDDAGAPTVDVGTTVGESLGSVGLFDREDAAREVAVVVARTVLDDANWVDATPPGGPTDADVRQN